MKSRTRTMTIKAENIRPNDYLLNLNGYSTRHGVVGQILQYAENKPKGLRYFDITLSLYGKEAPSISICEWDTVLIERIYYS